MIPLASVFRVLCAALFFSCVCVVQAHEPFDLSSRIVVAPQTIELTSTAGVDAARQILGGAGLNSEEIAASLRALAPDAVIDQPLGVADRLFRLEQDGRSLVPQKIVTRSEGLEIFFTVIYERPAGGDFIIHAVCYEFIPGLRTGSLVATDDAGGSLGAALLSAGNPRLEVRLPRRDPGIDAGKAGQTTTGDVSNSGVQEGLAAPNAAEPSPHEPSFGEFFWLGVEHILIGFDHLLFLAALLIGVRRLRTMAAVITCFTLGHSVTLALAALNLVSLSPRIIEPLIALSIMVVCVMNLVRRDAEGDRAWVAGGFGLIHGFGFASVLQSTGLVTVGSQFLMPLFSFNLGVETGQLAVAAVFLPLLFWVKKSSVWPKYGFPAVMAVLILASGYWCFERVFMG